MSGWRRPKCARMRRTITECEPIKRTGCVKRTSRSLGQAVQTCREVVLRHAIGQPGLDGVVERQSPGVDHAAEGHVHAGDSHHVHEPVICEPGGDARARGRRYLTFVEQLVHGSQQYGVALRPAVGVRSSSGAPRWPAPARAPWQSPPPLRAPSSRRPTTHGGSRREGALPSTGPNRTRERCASGCTWTRCRRSNRRPALSASCTRYSDARFPRYS